MHFVLVPSGLAVIIDNFILMIPDRIFICISASAWLCLFLLFINTFYYFLNNLNILCFTMYLSSNVRGKFFRKILNLS